MNKKPITDETVIWRYMALESFLSLLTKNSISFCRFDKLKSIDPYECANSKYELEQIDYDTRLLEQLGLHTDHPLLKDRENLMKLLQECKEKRDKQFFVNCWHVNDYESVAMWDSFTGNKTGVAIKTTLGKLKNALETKEYSIKYEPVEYVDLRDSKSNVDIILRKSMYFEHEKELRVYFNFVESCEHNDNNNEDINEIPTRIPIDYNLGDLISAVVVSPKSDFWFVDIINDLLKHYNIKVKAQDSEIRENTININLKQYELINEKEEFDRFIKNSSFNTSITYKMAYNPDNGEITGAYASNIDYKNIPEPYIIVSWSEWNKWCSNQEHLKVDIKEGKLTNK